MRLTSAVVGFLLFAPSLIARANSVVYNVTGSNVLSGTVSIDSSAGTITSSDLTVSTPNFTDMLAGTDEGRQGGTGYSISYFTSNDAYKLLLTSPNFDGTLKGFDGGAFIFSDALSVADTDGSLVAASTGSSVTPEPSSFALLGTGMLGVAGVLRKRFA